VPKAEFANPRNVDGQHLSSHEILLTLLHSFESFSLCSFRSDADVGDNRLFDVITQCCSAPVRQYQCWNYCAVEDSQFSTWIGCIETIRSSTWGAACQRVDHSVVSTITQPSSSSSTQSASPLEFAAPPTTITSSPTYGASSTSGAGWGGGTNITAAEWSPSIGTSNRSNNTPAYVIQAGSPDTFRLSLGGMICSFLVLSCITSQAF